MTDWDMWVSRSKWPKPPTPSTPTPPRSSLEPGPSSSRGRREQGATATTLTARTLPLPLPYPLSTETCFHAAPYPPGRTCVAQAGIWGNTRGAEMGAERRRRQRKGQRERIIVVVRSPCQENYPADAHTGAHKSVLELATPAWTRSVHLDAPGQQQGRQPVSGTADPGVVKQNKSSRASVDTTKTRSDPQRVRMCKGERPIGAAKGKLTPWPCANPPPPRRSPHRASPCD